MPEREIDPRRLVWVGPLTIICANAAVLTVRHVAKKATKTGSFR